MKKASISLLLIIAFAVFAFTGCSEPTHVHTLEKVNAKVKTCVNDGNEEHYKCTGCGKLFLDASGTQPAESADVTIPASHRFMPIAYGGKPATCISPGTKEYLKCIDCREKIAMDGHTVLSESDLEIPPTGVHALSEATHHPMVLPTCVDQGTAEYWECPDCHAMFADENGTIPIINLTFSPTGKHSLSVSEDYHTLVPSTCTSEGTVEYWECSVCHNKFSDSEGNTAITQLSIPKLAHQLTAHPAIPAQTHLPGYAAYWTCNECHKVFRDNAGEEETKLIALTIPATSGFVAVDGITTSIEVKDSGFFTGREQKIPDLYVCDHQVTQSEFGTYCIINSDYELPNEGKGLGDNHPIYGASYYDAIIYCNLRSASEGLNPVYSVNGTTDVSMWPGVVAVDGKYRGPDERYPVLERPVVNDVNGYRLPTDVEWEYIAFGGENGLAESPKYYYSGSDDADEVAWHYNNSNGKTHEVRTKLPNDIGVYDMSGNVSELSEGEGWYCRGGNFATPCDECWVLAAFGLPKNERRFCVGFRVVRTR
jgi:Uncharacterized conserved protein